MKPLTLGLAIAILVFLPHPAKSQETLKVIVPRPLEIDLSKGTGQTEIVFVNDSDKEAKLRLSADITGPKAGKSEFTFADQKDQKGDTPFEKKILAGETLRLWITANKLWPSGDLEADLNNDTTLLKKIRVTGAAINIKLEGAPTDKLEATLYDDQLYPLALRNEDDTPYSFTWKLWINGHAVCGGNINLPPRGVGLTNCSPNVEWEPARLRDLFKPETSNGNGNALALYPTSAGPDSAPAKTFPVAATLSAYQPFTQQSLGYGIIVLALILGGLTSLVLSQALPNRLRRLKVEEQIDVIAKATADLSSHVESKLQVLLRLERSQVRDLLNSRKTWSPDFQAIITACNQTLARLSSRVELAQQMDVVLRRLSTMLPRGVPPQQSDQIQNHVRAAAVLIGKAVLTDADLEAARLNITKASELVERVNQPDPAFGQQLAQRASAMKNEINTNFRGQNAAFDEMIKAVPGPDRILNRMPANTTEISADDYVQVDMAIEKMSLIRDYAIIADTINGDASERRKEPVERLIAFLNTSNADDLASARLLLRQMKDDVYGGRIAELLNDDGAGIEIDPKIAYHAAPMELCIHFRNSSLNSAAAREEWVCTWNFGDGLEENGWTVSHYFLCPTSGFFNKLRRRRTALRSFQVEARFQNKRTGQSTTADGKPLMLTRTLRVRPRAESGTLEGRTWTEGLKLAAALLIAVFGLVAGAREQLSQLDVLPGLVAVFLAGFGADTIKNLLTTPNS